MYILVNLLVSVHVFDWLLATCCEFAVLQNLYFLLILFADQFIFTILRTDQ